MLLRYQYAFLNGVSFTVGRSGHVQWSHTLPHQCFGAPDPTFIPIASRALDQACIPNDPQVCRQWILDNQLSLSLAAQMDIMGWEMQPLRALPTTGAVAALPMMGMRPGYVGRESPSLQPEVLYFDGERYSSVGTTDDRYSRHLEPVLICKEVGKEEDCPICLDSMVPTSQTTTTNVVCLKRCRHRFHKHCIMQMFDLNHDKCPYCREPVGLEPRGQGPSGSMTITVDHGRRCNGSEFNSDGIIMINYNMKGGIQRAGMENPGQRYSGTSRVAYLPHNETGRKLLVRLKYAFTHGLTFRVGTSITTGRSNQITWSSIYHKTSLNRGAFGFPDPQYFTNCNESLDALGVPKAEDCM